MHNLRRKIFLYYDIPSFYIQTFIFWKVITYNVKITVTSKEYVKSYIWNHD